MSTDAFESRVRILAPSLVSLTKGRERRVYESAWPKKANRPSRTGRHSDRKMSTGVWLTFSCLFSPGTWPRVLSHPHAGWTFPLQLSQLRSNLPECWRLVFSVIPDPVKLITNINLRGSNHITSEPEADNPDEVVTYRSTWGYPNSTSGIFLIASTKTRLACSDPCPTC